jgi:hypothetical protein
LKTKRGPIFDTSDEKDEVSDEDDLTANDIADESHPDDDDDLMSVASIDSEGSTLTTTGILHNWRLETVIEDSDDEIEILKM